MNTKIQIASLQQQIKEAQERIRILMQKPCEECGSMHMHDCICLDDEGECN